MHCSPVMIFEIHCLLVMVIAGVLFSGFDGIIGVTGAGVTGAGVTGAGVTGAGVTGAGVTGAGVTVGVTADSKNPHVLLLSNAPNVIISKDVILIP